LLVHRACSGAQGQRRRVSLGVDKLGHASQRAARQVARRHMFALEEMRPRSLSQVLNSTQRAPGWRISMARRWQYLSSSQLSARC
jgi:hypothetical protein